MRRLRFAALVIAALTQLPLIAQDKQPLFLDDLDVRIPHISEDESVSIAYDIVYVRADRAGNDLHKRFYTDFSQPVTMEPGADLVLLHPDGSEELLVDGGDGSVTDPVVSFDGEWVYYSYIYDLKNRSPWNPPKSGADIFKIHLKSRRIVRLTNQQFSPNTGAAEWSSDYRSNEKDRTHYDYGVFNMGPHPLPGGRIAFTSNRDGFKPAQGYPAIALQLFTMDDSDETIGDTATPPNLEKIGHLNISGALHPVVLKDGRIMYSTLESQGIRGRILWGIWTINPDGTNWAPLVSAFDPGGAPNGFHFQTQLSDGSIVIEQYYNQNNSGFGAYIKLPLTPPEGYAQFGPGWMQSPKNPPWRYGRHSNGKGRWYRMPFMPTGSVSLTPFSMGGEGPANPSILGDKESPKVGKFTHPSGAPDNHMLTVYSPGPVNHQYKYLPQLDGGIYLLKSGAVVEQPSQLVLIKNDPKYNESWPRAVVPYKAVYGIDEPTHRKSLANDGQGENARRLPKGTPFGLVGSSSMYKRESYPNGDVPEGKVTATFSGGNNAWKGLDAFTSHGNGMPINWHNQGADAGLYSNDEIHAVRILAMEPTTDRHRGANSGRRFYSHAMERLRILGEIPVRKFNEPPPSALHDKSRLPSGEVKDPDGNPDTSFLAKLPADTAFTFQTLDRNGIMLNMSQTWHQLRPGETRTDCGGCHAHSQKPTLFEDTIAGQTYYKVWDLSTSTPLVTARVSDDFDSRLKWDWDNETGIRNVQQEVVNVEYHRDIRPILSRSCIACHSGEKAAGNLNLGADDDTINVPNSAKLPGTYYRLAADEKSQFGHKPLGYDSWGYPNASRYIRKFQSRRSLLTWKLFGRRLDGFSNDEHPSESKPGARDFVLNGDPVDPQRNRARWDLDYTGSVMPPPAAVKSGKVKPLTDEDRRTIVRWIDLGCPIDLDYDPEQPDRRGYGWMLDDNRPILTLNQPTSGANSTLDAIIIGMHDYDSGLDLDSFSVKADFQIDDFEPGMELASHFVELSQGVQWLKFGSEIRSLKLGRIVVTIRDRQGNVSRIERLVTVK
jgi:hypothetical protein